MCLGRSSGWFGGTEGVCVVLWDRQLKSMALVKGRAAF